MATNDLEDGLGDGLDNPVLDPSVQANTTAVRIQKALKWLIIATCVLFIGMGGTAIYAYTISKNNRDAICAVRSEYQKRIVETDKFLETHPKGIPGISAAVLRRGRETNKQTVDALSIVSCPQPSIQEVSPIPRNKGE